jgi:hypothetical protein
MIFHIIDSNATNFKVAFFGILKVIRVAPTAGNIRYKYSQFY